MVNLSNDTKKRFDELQPSDTTQDEFVSRLLDTWEANGDPVVIDGDDIRDELEFLEARAEVAAYRGAKAALEDNA